MTSSTRYFVEAGRMRPATRLIAITANPTARRPRRGLMKTQTSGRSSRRRAGFSCLAFDSGLGESLINRVGSRYRNARGNRVASAEWPGHCRLLTSREACHSEEPKAVLNEVKEESRK